MKGKINWKIILIHSLAVWFIIHSFHQFSFLYKIEYYKYFLKYIIENQKFNSFTNQEITPGKAISHFFYCKAFGNIIGCFVGLMISIIVCKKYNWSIINSLIVFVLMFLLARFYLLGWNYIGYYFTYLGNFLHNLTWSLLLNGFVLIIPSFLLFFSKKVIVFIGNYKEPLRAT